MNKWPFIFMAALLSSCAEPEQVLSENGEINTLEPSFTIGVELGDSTLMFGAVEKALYDSNGNIAVLDMASANVRIFSPEGEYLRTIGRRGNGPGEFQRPLGMVLLGNGSLAVIDPWGEGLTGINSSYEQSGVLLDIHSNVPLGMCAVDSVDIVALRVGESTSEEPSFPMMIGRYTMSTEPSVVYWHKEYQVFTLEEISLAMRDVSNVYWTADRETQEVYVAPYQDNVYIIYRYSPEGELIGTIEMDIEQVPRTDEEKAEVAAYLRARLAVLNGTDMGVEIAPYPNRRSIEGLGIDGQGYLWVRRGTEVPVRLDRWTPSGELIGSYTVPGSDPYWRFSFCHDGILAYNENPDEYQRIFVMEYPAAP